MDVKGCGREDSSTSGGESIVFEDVRTGKRAFLLVVIGDLMVEASLGRMVPLLDSSICLYSSFSANLTQKSVAHSCFFSFFTWLKNLSEIER